MATVQIPPENLLSQPFLMNSISSTFRSKLLLSSSKVRCFCASSVDLKSTHELVLEKTCRKRAGVNSRARASDSEFKENWLDSISCPFLDRGMHSSIEDKELNASYSGSGWVIGIDPDSKGAVALLKDDYPEYSARVFDTPHVQVLVGKRVRRRLDAKSIVELLHSFGAPLGTTAYIEQSNPFPKDGRQGWWSGGFGYGLWIGILVASGFTVVPVPSLLWKNQFDLSRAASSKDDSRKLASDLFPSLSPLLKRKKDHGRAEALLIAAYGKGLTRQIESHDDNEKLQNELNLVSQR